MTRKKSIPAVNWINAYYDDLISGAAAAGRYVIKIYRRLLDGISNGEYIYDVSALYHFTQPQIQ